ncbi:MAG: membrane dipeptidase [Bacillota bacterium]|nr:membrane dipeptidase [Bacillota bacterium]
MRLFDCHCDTISRIYDEGGNLSKNSYHIDLEKASVYKNYVQIFAIWGDSSSESDMEGRFRAQLKLAKSMLNGQNGAPVLCRDAQSLGEALMRGRCAAFLSVEGAELLGCSEEVLSFAFSEGVRFVNITWNNKNAIGTPSAYKIVEGLSSEGKEFVRKMELLGVVPDVSHLSEQGFFDVAEITKRPFIASHSNARVLCRHRRNLTDEQLGVLIKRNCICGINLYAAFLSDDPDSCTVDTVVNHIEYIASLGGEHILALGCDFDGCDQLPKGIKTVSDLKKVYEALLRKNYAESLVDDIFFGNMYRFVQKRIEA